MTSEYSLCDLLLKAISNDDTDAFKKLYCYQSFHMDVIVRLEAIKKGRVEIVKYLFEETSEDDTHDYFECVIEYHQTEIVEFFLSYTRPRENEIKLAIMIHNVKMTEIFIVEYIDIMKTYDMEFNSEIITRLIHSMRPKDCDFTHLIDMILDVACNKKEFKKLESTLSAACIEGFKDIALKLYHLGYPMERGIHTLCYDIDLFKFFLNVSMEKYNMSKDFIDLPYGCGIEHYEYAASKGFSIQSGHSKVLYSKNIEVVKYLHAENHEWDEEFSILKITYPEVAQYCHDNEIPRKWPHEKGCIHCKHQKVRHLSEIWELESEEYNSSLQWLPLEICDDIIALSGNDITQIEDHDVVANNNISFPDDESDEESDVESEDDETLDIKRIMNECDYQFEGYIIFDFM